MQSGVEHSRRLSPALPAMSVSSPPLLFVDWSACERVLSGALDGGGVRVCCLLSLDGSVLCVAGELHAAKLLSALLAAVYAQYSDATSEQWREQHAADDSAATNPSPASPLRALLVGCDEGLVSVARVGRFLVAVQSDDCSATGQIAQKVAAAHTAAHTTAECSAAHTAPHEPTRLDTTAVTASAVESDGVSLPRPHALPCPALPCPVLRSLVSALSACRLCRWERWSLRCSRW